MIYYDNGNSFCEHSRKKGKIQILGQYVTEVQGCYFRK